MSNYSNNELNNAIEIFYNTRNKIVVNAPTGSNIVASCEGVTVNVTEIGTSGTWYFYYTKFGRWIINGTNGQNQGSGYVDVYEVKDYSVTLNISSPISSNLETSSWSDIQIIAQSSLGSSYWAVGDSKTVTLSGTVKSITFNNTSIKAFIIGFDHNSEIEGTGIHFQLGKSSGNIDICFVDSKYNSEVTTSITNPGNYFTWDYYNSSTSKFEASRWNNGNIQKNILGQDINNKVGFLAVLPSALVNCIKITPKYSAEGLSNNLLFLLSAFEVLEYNVGGYSIYQRRYDYYKNNSCIKYDYTNLGVAKNYFLRDWATQWYLAGLIGTSGPLVVSDQGTLTAYGSVIVSSRSIDQAIAPCFVIG